MTTTGGPEYACSRERRREERVTSRADSEGFSIKYLAEELQGLTSLFRIYSVEGEAGVHHHEVAHLGLLQQGQRHGSPCPTEVDHGSLTGTQGDDLTRNSYTHGRFRKAGRESEVDIGRDGRVSGVVLREKQGVRNPPVV
jgi:hypothetical protein